MRALLFIIFIFGALFSEKVYSFYYHEKGQTCVEDRLFVADLDMNDSCVLWEALYETSDDQPGSSLSNGEFIVLIKPIAYGAKDNIQIILRDQTKIQGDYNLHKGAVTSISPETS